MSQRPRGLTASDRLLHTRLQPDTVLLMSPAPGIVSIYLGRVALSADLYGPRRTSLWDSLRGLATMPALWALLPCLAHLGSASCWELSCPCWSTKEALLNLWAAL